MSDEARRALVRPPTPAQMRVLRLIAEGRTKREMAGLLYLAEATVRTHVQALLRRVHARSRAHAVAIAYQRGWLEIAEDPRVDLEGVA